MQGSCWLWQSWPHKVAPGSWPGIQATVHAFAGRREGGGQEECGFEECLTQGRNSSAFISGLGFQLGSNSEPPLPFLPLPLSSLLWLPYHSGLLGTESGLFFFKLKSRGNQKGPWIWRQTGWVPIPRSLSQ